MKQQLLEAQVKDLEAKVKDLEAQVSRLTQVKSDLKRMVLKLSYSGRVTDGELWQKLHSGRSLERSQINGRPN